MATRSEVIPVELEDGSTIQVMATLLGGERDVSAVARAMSFTGVAASIEGVAASLAKTLQKVRPNKASIEFSIEVAVKEGQLSALLVQGSATGNLKVNLEWTYKATPG